MSIFALIPFARALPRGRSSSALAPAPTMKTVLFLNIQTYFAHRGSQVLADYASLIRPTFRASRVQSLNPRSQQSIGRSDSWGGTGWLVAEKIVPSIVGPDGALRSLVRVLGTRSRAV